MDVARRGHLSFQKRSFSAENSFPKDEPTHSVHTGDLDLDSTLEDDDVLSLETDGEQQVYVTLEGLGLHDDELPRAFATMQEERRKTWNHNRDSKRKMEVDCKFFDRSKDKPELAYRQQRGHRAANGQ
eukprot:5578322-Pyramimonas_sp.AAC.1